MADTRPCPLCASDVPWPWPPFCPGCAAPLGSDTARELAGLDDRLAALHAQRQRLVAALRQGRPAAAVATPPASGGGGGGDATVVAGPGGTARGPLSKVPAQTLLAGAGVLLLAVAAIVFVAVTWEQLSGLSRALILLVVTALSAAASSVLARRHLATTADAVGLLTVALALVDVHGGRALGLFALDAVPQALYIALTSLLLAPLARVFAEWSGTRAPRVAAALLLVSVGPALAIHLVDLGWSGESAVVWTSLVAAGGLALDRRRVSGPVDRPWERGVLGVGGAGLWAAAFLAAPASLLDDIALAFEEVGDAAWKAPALSAVSDWPSFALSLVVLASIPLWLATVERVRAARNAAVAVTAVAVLVATAVGGLPAWLRVAAGLAVVAVAIGWVAAGPAARRGERSAPGTGPPFLAATALGLVVTSAWVLGWALVDAWLTTASLALLAVGGAVLAWRLVDPAQRRVAAVLAASLGLAALTTSVPAVGGGWGTAGLVLAAAASVVLLAAGRLLAVDDLVAAEVVAVAAGVVGIGLALGHTVSLGGAETARLAATFAVTGVAGVLHALQTRRWLASYVGSTLFSGVLWTLLADGEVSTVEYYTLPLAGLLLGAGLWHLAIDREVPSMGALSPGLSAALAPTALQVLGDPSDLLRVVLLAAAGAGVLTAGTRLRLAAPVLYGVGAVAVAALTQLAVAADHLPRWVTFAVLGLALVGFSATYERQRQRLAGARRHLTTLR